MQWVNRTAPERLTFSEISDISLIAATPASIPHRPVIAISGFNSQSKSVTAAMAVIRAEGGIPLFVGNFPLRSGKGVQQGVAEVLSMADGIMVMGNNDDVDPRKSGQQVHSKTHIEEPVRAAFEEELIRQAIAARMPLMGICGGMQRLNVVCGGTLHQHVPDLVGHDHHGQGGYNIPAFLPTHEIALRPGTRLAALAGTPKGGKIKENSYHHQAVNFIPAPFIASAMSQEGLAEAIEPAPGSALSNQFILGVQWHPEFGSSDLGPALMREMIVQSHAYAQANNRIHHPAQAEIETIRSSLPDFKQPQQAIEATPQPQAWVARYQASRSQAEIGLGA